MTLSFHGAARTVTGSKHLLALQNGTNILLDCGLFQGLGVETDDLNADFGFDAASISFVILSHAHIDHSGLLPKLVKEGFTGKIYATPATKELTEILLHDSAEIQTYEAVQNGRKGVATVETAAPLYTVEDADNAIALFETVERDEWFSPTEDVKVLLTNAGHLAGSAVVNLVITENGKETRICYSGDVGRFRSILLAPPAEFPQADYIILESTYGNKLHNIKFNAVDMLHKWIVDTCVKKQGKLLIPAFSVGRTQELLYTLNQLGLEKRLPPIKYFVDSPLSHKATEVIKKYVHHFNDRMQKVLEIDDDPFDFEGLAHVDSVEDSIKLTEYTEPCVIISASGTADAGRVRHHLHTSLQNNFNTVLMSGYCSPSTTGGRLLSGIKKIELYGDECNINADINKLDGLSAHGDVDDLLRFVSCQNVDEVKEIFLVHGEYSVQEEFSAKLHRKGFPLITVPSMHRTVEL
jgi:metallo-beta-lactamase family protein